MNYSQKDLANANQGVAHGLTDLDVDKLWAEHRLSEQLARIEDEGPCMLPVADPRTIQSEVLSLRQTRLPRTGSCHEL